MNDVDVTILCTTYNHAEYIRECLEGFVKQITDYRFEIVIHDDASTDGTQEIIQEYIDRFPGLFLPVFQKENLHSKKISRRSYIDPLIHGKYIAFCEGDDYWIDPNKLQKQIGFLEKHPDFAMCATSGLWHNERDQTDTEQFIVGDDTEINIDNVIMEKNGRMFSLNSIVVKREVYFYYPEWRKYITLATLSNALIADQFGKIMMLSDVTCVYRYGTPGSWSNRIKNNEMRRGFAEKIIKGYELYNQETNYAHKESVNYIIHKHQLTIAVIDRKLISILFGKNHDAFSRLSKKEKLAIIIQCISPKLFNWFTQKNA